MSGYRHIALQDLDEAHFNLENKRYRPAVFFFQQFAEKSAKALLEKTDPEHRLLKSHMVEKILEAYDETHKVSEIGDKARYLTGFYFDTRYPGDNYAEITEAQAVRAGRLAGELEVYFRGELGALAVAADGVTLEIESLPGVGVS